MAGKREECVRGLPPPLGEDRAAVDSWVPMRRGNLHPDNVKLPRPLGVSFILVYERASYMALVGLKLTGILLPVPPKGRDYGCVSLCMGLSTTCTQ